MSKCSKCGAEIKEGNSFCSKCGNRMEAESKFPDQSQIQTKTQTQTSSTTSSIAPTQTETPKKKKSTGVKVLLGCLIAFVVVIVVGGIVGYILIKKGVEKAQNEIKKAEENWSDEVEGLKELENVGEDIKEEVGKGAGELENQNENETNSLNSNEAESDEPTKKVSKIVEEFMACTLGTIPQVCPSSNKDNVAKKHLTLEMRTSYNSETFIPSSYCIQDGPEDVRVDSETEAGGFAYVLVSAKYGTDDFTPSWNFILIEQDGEWKIKEIQCLNF